MFRQDRFVAKVKRVYQRIEEFSCEANYEYYSEQDMPNGLSPLTVNRKCFSFW